MAEVTFTLFASTPLPPSPPPAMPSPGAEGEAPLDALVPVEPLRLISRLVVMSPRASRATGRLPR